MLRLPPFEYHRPDQLAEAVALLAEHAGDVMPISGGTDLIPNMKHRLFTPGHLVSLRSIPDLHGIEVQGEELVIGAGETLTAVATNPLVHEYAPSLAEAARHVSGPQLRNRGTIGGNLCLDTRCTYYNQTHFWRDALGYCLKKEGTVCHVTRVGNKCVAAHSADTPPVLMTLGAEVDLQGPQGSRSMRVREFFLADGIWNSRRKPEELLTRIRIPLPSPGLRTAYVKLRQRGSIDFPLLTVAVAARTDEEGTIEEIGGVVTALGAKPRELTGWDDLAVGETLSQELVEALAQRAHDQCHPLENIIVDAEWRRAMVPVYVSRALRKLIPA